MGINNLIEDLVFYGRTKLNLTLEDSIYARNQLLELFQVEPSEESGKQVGNLQEEVLMPLVDYAIDNDLTEEGTELRFETKILGLVTPSNGLVIKTYEEILKKDGIKAATDYLYNLSIDTFYIRLSDIKKNICWYAQGDKGEIGITINLSKPEKDAKQVLFERNFQGKKYPKCMLCLENLGFFGTVSHPARQTLRVVPIVLNEEKWHMQYSPYVYYDEHCIAFSDEHRPMQITQDTFVRLLDFVDIFPHYFIGSNADLPIVGGSILAHEHYQGGKKVLPMFSRPVKKIYCKADKVRVGRRDWYNSVVTVSGEKQEVIWVCGKIMEFWRQYSDKDNNILAKTDQQHNTVTPIATKNGKEYCVDIILRNNRTDEKHPFGIFHPTEDMHNIKKEGIGLIEAMGLFILPGRLKSEIFKIIEVLSSEQIDFEAINTSEINAHMGLIAQIVAKNGTKLAKDEARNLVIKQIDQICLDILECTAVFKNNADGDKAFETFMTAFCNKMYTELGI